MFWLILKFVHFESPGRNLSYRRPISPTTSKSDNISSLKSRGHQDLPDPYLKKMAKDVLWLWNSVD